MAYPPSAPGGGFGGGSSGGGVGGFGDPTIGAGGGGGGTKKTGTSERNPKKELLRGIAKILKSQKSGMSPDSMTKIVQQYAKGLNEKEIRSVARRADIPRDVENYIVGSIQTQKQAQKNLGSDNGFDINPIAVGGSALGFALRQASRPNQAVMSAWAEWSRQGEKARPKKSEYGWFKRPSNNVMDIIFGPPIPNPYVRGSYAITNWGKVGKALKEGFALKRSDSPVTITKEAGDIRVKKGYNAKPFGFVPGADMRKGEVIPYAGKPGLVAWDIGGSMAMDPFTYASFGASAATKAAIGVTRRILGAERAAQVVAEGTSVLSDAEKIALGDKVVRNLAGAKPGIKLRFPGVAPRTVIPYGRAGTLVEQGVQKARLLPVIRNVDVAFSARARIKQAEAAGRLPAGTADKVDAARVSFNATKSADEELAYLKWAARETKVSRKQAEEVMFALDEGNPASLATQAQRDYYDLIDAFRRDQSGRLREAGVISSADEVTRKRVAGIEAQYETPIQRQMGSVEAAAEKTRKAGAAAEQRIAARTAAEEADMARAQKIVEDTVQRRNDVIERRAIAEQQREVQRQFYADDVAARKQLADAERELRDAEKQLSQIAKTVDARDIQKVRAEANAAATRVTALRKEIDNIETQIRKLERKIKGARGWGAERKKLRETYQREIQKYKAQLAGKRSALKTATKQAENAKTKLDEFISARSGAGVSSAFGKLDPAQLADARRLAQDRVDELRGIVDNAKQKVARTTKLVRQAKKKGVIRTGVLPSRPGQARPQISRLTALERERAATKLETLRIAAKNEARQRKGLARLLANRARRIGQVVPGIEDEFYVPHIVTKESKARDAADADLNMERIDLSRQQGMVDRRRPGFTKARRSGLSLREKAALADSKYKGLVTNPGQAFAMHAIEGNREIATRRFLADLTELQDNAGNPLVETVDDYLNRLKEQGLPELEEYDDIAQIPKNVVDEILQRSGKKLVKVERIGDFLMDTAVAPYAIKTASLAASGELASFARFVDKWMSIWKSYATLPFPFGAGFSLRNGTGNVALNWLADIQPTDPAYLQAANLQKKLFSLRRAGKTLDEAAMREVLNPEEFDIITNALQREILGSGFNAADLLEDPILAFQSAGKRLRATINPANQEFALLRAGRAFNGMIENNARLAHFIAKYREIGDFDGAAASVRKYLFDYADLTPFEQTVMKRVIPFYTFMRKNTPLWVGTFFTRPDKYSRLEQWRRAFYDVAGRPEPGVQPRYLEAAGAFPSPFKLGGLPTLAAPDLPPAAASETITPFLQLIPGTQKLGLTPNRPQSTQEALAQILNMTGGGLPGAGKTVAEIVLGKQLFSGRPFYPGEQAPAPAYLFPIKPLLGKKVIQGEEEKKAAIPYTVQYALEQNLPLLPKINALFPQTAAGRDTQLRRLLSMLSGFQAYPIGDPTVRTELFKRVQEINQILDQIRSSGGKVPTSLKR